MEAKLAAEIPLQPLPNDRYPTLFLTLVEKYQTAIAEQFWFFREFYDEATINQLLNKAGNTHHSVGYQCVNILVDLFKLKYQRRLSESSLTQKLIIDVFIFYLTIGHVTERDYARFIQFFYAQKNKHHFVASSVDQALIDFLLAFKVHKLINDQKITAYVEFLRQLNRTYQLDNKSPEQSFVDALVTRIILGENAGDGFDFQPLLQKIVGLSSIEKKEFVGELIKLHCQYALALDDWDQDFLLEIVRPDIENSAMEKDIFPILFGPLLAAVAGCYQPLAFEPTHWLNVLFVLKEFQKVSDIRIYSLVSKIILQQASHMPATV